MLSEYPVFPILLSTDLAASRAFYLDRLGLELVDEREERLVFRCGADTRLIISLSTVGTLDTQTQVAWRVPDVHAAIADLRARGVRIEDTSRPIRSRPMASPIWATRGQPGSSTPAATSYR